MSKKQSNPANFSHHFTDDYYSPRYYRPDTPRPDFQRLNLGLWLNSELERMKKAIEEELRFRELINKKMGQLQVNENPGLTIFITEATTSDNEHKTQATSDYS